MPWRRQLIGSFVRLQLKFTKMKEYCSQFLTYRWLRENIKRKYAPDRIDIWSDLHQTRFRTSLRTDWVQRMLVFNFINSSFNQSLINCVGLRHMKTTFSFESVCLCTKSSRDYLLCMTSLPEAHKKRRHENIWEPICQITPNTRGLLLSLIKNNYQQKHWLSILISGLYLKGKGPWERNGRSKHRAGVPLSIQYNGTYTPVSSVVLLPCRTQLNSTSAQ